MTSKTWCETYPEREADDPCTHCHHQDLCDELGDLERCIWKEVGGFLTKDDIYLLGRLYSAAKIMEEKE